MHIFTCIHTCHKGYTMGRTTIGSCDFSVTHYNYDDVKDDFNLDHFSIAHDQDQIIPFIKKAVTAVEKTSGSKETLKLIASPWSAPAWMKSNNNMNCDLGPWTCVLKSDEKYKNAWALYLSKYLTAYNSAGVPIYAMTVQNEPESMTGNIVYEGMHFTPQTEHAFLKNNLIPRMKSDHPDVKILIYDHNKDHILDWMNEILADKDIAQSIWGVGFHWYTGPFFENLAKAHDLFPNHVLFSTEATSPKQNPHTYDKPDLSKGEFYASELLGDLNNWSVGFIDWNIILDDFGGPNHGDPTGYLCEGLLKCGSDAMLIADLKNKVLQPQAFYYYVGHVSKYVPRGSIRVEIQLNNENGVVQACALLAPNNQVVVIAMNSGNTDIAFVLQDTLMGLNVSMDTVLPSHSIQTFIYDNVGGLHLNNNINYLRSEK